MNAKSESVESFHLGINTHDFRPLKKNKEFAESLGISDDDNVIVFIGTIYPFSGLIELVSDFDKIEKKNQNTKLVIVGGGPSFKKLQKFVIKKNLENKVILTNFKPQKELPKYISLADICINPFQINYVTNRILPTKILEYFACGKPVLSTPLSGTKELLPDETFGILYSTSENFTRNLSDLLSKKDRLKQLGTQAYEYVQKNHDWEILSNQLVEKFESLIKKSNS